MPKDKPEIRFAGYTDAWEKRKLGDNIIQYNEHTIENNQYPVFTSSRKGLFFQKDYYDGHQIASVDNTGYNIVPKGYFTYRHMSDDLIFKFNINDLADYGIVSTLYPVFTTTENLDAMYLMYQLNEGTEFKRFSLLQKQGGSRTYMYFSKLKELKLTIPNIKEQKSISELFKQLDSLITVNQRKVDLLKELKKGFLQKMFPKNGEDKPEIRFAGYTDAWEKRNVTEVAKVSIGLVTTMTAHYTDRGTLLIRNSDIKSGRFDFDENPIYLTSEFADQNQNRKLVLGDVVTVHTGDIGTSAVISHSEDGAIGFATINSRPNGSLLNSEYFATFLNTQGHKNFAFRMATGDGRLNYNLKDFNKLYVPTPTVNEQKQIGTFFKLLDNLIAVNQRRVDLLKQEKKALLQKMFV